MPSIEITTPVRGGLSVTPVPGRSSVIVIVNICPSSTVAGVGDRVTVPASTVI